MTTQEAAEQFAHGTVTPVGSEDYYGYSNTGFKQKDYFMGVSGKGIVVEIAYSGQFSVYEGIYN